MQKDRKIIFLKKEEKQDEYRLVIVLPFRSPNMQHCIHVLNT